MMWLSIAAATFLLLQSPHQTPHLVVSTSSSVVDDGVDLYLNIRMRDGWHAYAPGNPGYVALALEVDSATAVAIPPLTLPPPETFLFRMSEEVRVFRGEFRATQRLKLTADELARIRRDGVRMSGRLIYQACTETACSLKTALALKWPQPKK